MQKLTEERLKNMKHRDRREYIKKEKRRQYLEKQRKQRNLFMAIGVFIIGIILITAFIYQPSKKNVKEDVITDFTAPNFTLTDIEGNEFTLSNFKGKVVVLEFISTEQNKSKQQSTSLKEVNSKYNNNEVILFSIDVGNGNLNDYKKDNGINWRMGKDTKNVSKLYNVVNTPIIFFVDYIGIITFKTDDMEIGKLKDEIDRNLNRGNDVGKSAINFALKDINDKGFTLSSFRGKVVLIDYMATWCVPCKEQMKYIKELHSKYDKNIFATISIDVDSGETDTQLKEFKNTYGGNWTFAVDKSDISYNYQITSIPALFIIDKNGVISYKHVGIATSETLANEIDKLV